MNHHTLSDLRTQHVEFLDGVLTQSVAAILEQELVEMDRVAQDGMRGSYSWTLIHLGRCGFSI